MLLVHLRTLGIWCAAWSGAKERGDIYEQAVKLGGGSEALLGLVEGTLRAGRPCSGSVYAAACRCALLSSCHLSDQYPFVI